RNPTVGALVSRFATLIVSFPSPRNGCRTSGARSFSIAIATRAPTAVGLCGAQLFMRMPRRPTAVGARVAILLNCDRYTCAYCSRSAWHAHEELGATLRFELDHRRAKSRLHRRDDFDLRNMRTACRSCNVIKGQMEASRFLRELRSLARAALRTQSTVDER